MPVGVVDTVILSFLAEHPETGFSPREIHEATEVPRGSVGTTLRRLEDRGLVRHKEPYWAIDPRGIEAAEAVHRSLDDVRLGRRRSGRVSDRPRRRDREY